MPRLQGPFGAKILILKAQPGEKDFTQSEIFNGYEGVLINNLISKASITPTEFIWGSIADERSVTGGFFRYFHDKEFKQPNSSMQLWLEKLEDVIRRYKPNIVVTLGLDTLKCIAHRADLESVRGTAFECTLGKEKFNILPTYEYDRLRTDVPQQFTFLMDLRKAKRISKNPDILNQERELIPSATFAEFSNYLDFLEQDFKVKNIVLDIENTPGPECFITELGLSHDANFGITFPIKNISLDEETEIWRKFAKLAANPHKRMIMQNGKHDLSVIWKNQNILIQNFYFDTLVAAQLCWPELKKNLGFLSSLLLHVPAWKHLPGDPYYNVQDVANTFGIYEVLEQELQKRGMWEFFLGKMEELEIAAYCELRGVTVNQTKMKKLASKVKEDTLKVKAALDDIVKPFGTFNYNSPTQMKDLLYKHLKLPEQFKRRKSVKEERKLTTDSEALRKLANSSNSAFPKLLLEYKKLTKLTSSFLELYPSPESKVHASFNVDSSSEEANKSLGRWSSSASIILPFGTKTNKINLQNIPEFAREMYVPNDRNKIFVAPDYAQAEAVVVAYLSGDEPLKEAFKIKKDIHIMKASEIFGIPYDELFEMYLAKEVEGTLYRKIGKLTRHATNYDGTAPVLQNFLNMAGIYKSLSECKELILKSKNASPYLTLYHKWVENEIKTKRFLTNPFGRNRIFMGQVTYELLKKAYAFIPQSTVGDLLNLAMKDFYKKYGSEYDLAFPLHDGMYIESLIENLVDCAIKLYECMQIPITIKGETFYIDVDFKYGPNWKDLKEVDNEELFIG